MNLFVTPSQPQKDGRILPEGPCTPGALTGQFLSPLPVTVKTPLPRAATSPVPTRSRAAPGELGDLHLTSVLGTRRDPLQREVCGVNLRAKRLGSPLAGG